MLQQGHQRRPRCLHAPSHQRQRCEDSECCCEITMAEQAAQRAACSVYVETLRTYSEVFERGIVQLTQ